MRLRPGAKPVNTPPLPAEDPRRLTEAEAWLDLGNATQATAELENILPSNRTHPDVLELRWQIYARATKWPARLDIAAALGGRGRDVFTPPTRLRGRAASPNCGRAPSVVR